jgi:hypothetical protein
MIRIFGRFPYLAFILLAVSLCLVMILNCDKPTRPDFCWVRVDTLYASGISVHDTSAVRLAFESYIAFVDTTVAEFPNEEHWTYLTSRPFHTWRGRFYWQVDHEAYSPSLNKRVLRRLVYVDQNGVVVRPYGCI